MLLYSCMLSHVWLLVTWWTVACQAPLSMGFSRQNTGVNLTQESNPNLLQLLNWQVYSLPLSIREAPYRILLSDKKEQNIDTCNSLDESLGNYMWLKKIMISQSQRVTNHMIPFTLSLLSCQSCPTLCHSTDYNTPGLLTELAQTLVHWVGDAIQPPHSQSSPSSPALNLSQHQCLFQWVSSSHQVAKVLKLQHQSFRWILRVDFL